MRKRQYFSTWTSRAFVHSFGRADAVSTAIGIFGPFLLKLLKGDRGHEMMSSDLVWQIPLGSFAVLAAYRIVMTPYWMHQEAEARWNGEAAAMKSMLVGNDDPVLTFGETKTEHKIGSMKHETIARIALRHTGPRSVTNTRVRVVGLAPISPSAPESIKELCDVVVPFFLNTKFDGRDVFELHNQRAPEWIDVAFIVKTVDILFLLRTKSGQGSDRPLPRGDYIIVLEANGHNARPALGVFLLGDRAEELIFQPLAKPIGHVLGEDHPLAKQFDPAPENSSAARTNKAALAAPAG